MHNYILDSKYMYLQSFMKFCAVVFKGLHFQKHDGQTDRTKIYLSTKVGVETSYLLLSLIYIKSDWRTKKLNFFQVITGVAWTLEKIMEIQRQIASSNLTNRV